MKERTCRHCGDEVVLAERGETVTGGETPVEHMERTGHAWNEPRLFQCNDCGNVWGYTGSAETPTCSNCRGKRTEPVEG